MGEDARGCVKTQAFNLRVESFSQFRQSKEEYRCGGDRKKVNRENNALPCWLLSVFTQPRPKPDLDDIGEVRTSVSGFHQASSSPWREVRKSFREGLMKRLKLAAAPGQKLPLKELLAG